MLYPGYRKVKGYIINCAMTALPATRKDTMSMNSDVIICPLRGGEKLLYISGN